ncbi:MAG: CoA transferase [Rhodospirillales bacterium]|jgi:crotonobetainyl-CoA:carnitine CoA-transferase CaiB-like acyl-CoA transferase|nr:CoA transferase [Rhodospirillales bacterium]
MGKVLEGIRVLDFGRYIAGPFCATLLGDFGAEVIRIESVKGSADRYTSPLCEAGDGALFMAVGRGKLGMTLNAGSPEGREIVQALIATADIVVVNQPEEILEAMGLDHESLKEIKPDIILANATAFGTTGPYAERLGFDGSAQAMSGAMDLTGYEDEPMRSLANYADFSTAGFTAMGVLAALLERNKTGRGQKVEGNLLASALTCVSSLMVEQGVVRPDRKAQGNRSPQVAPGDAYATNDGWIFVMCVGDPLFRRWAGLMGETHWLEDARFADDQSRGDHGEIISERMALWCAERSNAGALSELEAARIPAGPVFTLQDALDDEHVREAGWVRDVDYPGLPRPATIPDTPVRLSETPAVIERRAPMLGEHTDGILAGLGYSEARISELREKGII